MVKRLTVLMLGKGRTDTVYLPPLTEVVDLIPYGQINAIEVVDYPRDW